MIYAMTDTSHAALTQSSCRYLYMAGCTPRTDLYTATWVADRLQTIHISTGIAKAGFLADAVRNWYSSNSRNRQGGLLGIEDMMAVG